jgi:hypothetical protein
MVVRDPGATGPDDGATLARLLVLALLLGSEDGQERVVARFRLAVRATDAIRPCEVLAVVDSEVEVVKGMMRGPVDQLLEGVARDKIRVVDEDRPEVDRDEQPQVDVTVEGQHVDDGVVRH